MKKAQEAVRLYWWSLIGKVAGIMVNRLTKSDSFVKGDIMLKSTEHDQAGGFSYKGIPENDSSVYTTRSSHG
jgi:hypothetical protein